MAAGRGGTAGANISAGPDPGLGPDPVPGAGPEPGGMSLLPGVVPVVAPPASGLESVLLLLLFLSWRRQRQTSQSAERAPKRRIPPTPAPMPMRALAPSLRVLVWGEDMLVSVDVGVDVGCGDVEVGEMESEGVEGLCFTVTVVVVLPSVLDSVMVVVVNCAVLGPAVKVGVCFGSQLMVPPEVIGKRPTLGIPFGAVKATVI